MWITSDLNCLFAPNIYSVGVVTWWQWCCEQRAGGLLWSDPADCQCCREGPSPAACLAQSGACSPMLCSDFSSITWWRRVIFCQSCTTASKIKGLNARTLERASLEASGGKWREGAAEGRAGKQVPWSSEQSDQPSCKPSPVESLMSSANSSYAFYFPLLLRRWTGIWGTVIS